MSKLQRLVVWHVDLCKFYPYYGWMTSFMVARPFHKYNLQIFFPIFTPNQILAFCFVFTLFIIGFIFVYNLFIDWNYVLLFLFLCIIYTFNMYCKHVGICRGYYKIFLSFKIQEAKYNLSNWRKFYVQINVCQVHICIKNS